MALWEGLIDGLAALLNFYHDLVEPLPFLGGVAWGWAIILLTFTVRLVLLPLAVKQINSMRAMQQLAPEMKKIQDKYKADRTLMKKNPDKYRERKQKQQEAMMTLYRENKVNPAAGCLPLLAQMPVFFALFMLLRDEVRVPQFSEEGFYFIDNLASLTINAGIGAWVLVVLMGATTYIQQKQMMSRNPAASQQPQQKILLYVLPLLLPVFAINLPVGVALYWVATNLWTMGQQWFMFRNIQPEPAGGKAAA